MTNVNSKIVHMNCYAIELVIQSLAIGTKCFDDFDLIKMLDHKRQRNFLLRSILQHHVDANFERVGGRMSSFPSSLRWLFFHSLFLLWFVILIYNPVDPVFQPNLHFQSTIHGNDSRISHNRFKYPIKNRYACVFAQYLSLARLSRNRRR